MSRRCPTNERQALAKLVEAAQVFDALFLRQVWAGNESMLLDLVARHVAGRAGARCTTSCSTRGRGRGSTRTTPFIPGAPAKPEQANFYPAGATKADVEAWLETLREAERRRATGFFTTIRRGPDGSFDGRALQRRISGRARARWRRCCARPRR